MNVYDKIVCPIDNLNNLIELIKIYCNLKDNGQLNNMYSFIVNNNENLSSEKIQKYNNNYFNHMVIPTAIEFKDNLLKNKCLRNNDQVYIYSLYDMDRILKERTILDIISKGQSIEQINPNVFDALNYEVFWKYGNINRIELYYDFLSKNGINLTQNEFKLWLDYRALLEEFQDPSVMGFFRGDEIGIPKAKLYINAGEDTYEIANMFYSECKKMNIDTMFKVAMGNVLKEINRNDKMCVYVDDLNKLGPYINILEKIKKQRPDFNFKNPILTTGVVNGWIGIGSDITSTYNIEMCSVIIDSCNKCFGNLSGNEIMQQINNNQTLYVLCQTIKQECYNKGLDYQKICVKSEDVELLKQVNIDNQIESNTNNNGQIENYINNIETSKVDEETFEYLYKLGYNGEFKDNSLNLAYKLYCENKKMKKEYEYNIKQIRYKHECNIKEMTNEIAYLKMQLGMISKNDYDSITRHANPTPPRKI